MRSRTVVLGVTTLAIAAGAVRGFQTPAPATGPSLDDRPLYTFNEADVDRYLRELAAREPDLRRRVIHLGRKNIGQPYQIYLLGEFPYELYDPDPLYRLDKSDCVTFCEHTFAMGLAHDWPSFFRLLQRIRYKDGVIGMLTRNHYTITDWDRNNAFLFEDLTQKLGDGKVSVPLHKTVKRARFFAKFGIGQDIPDEEVVDAYIPKENVPGILSELRDADFVNIIRGDATSQWAGHTGLIALAADGAVNFLHSAEPAVCEQPLLEYLDKDKRCLGIKILRLRDSAQTTANDFLNGASTRVGRAPPAARTPTTADARQIEALADGQQGWPSVRAAPDGKSFVVEGTSEQLSKMNADIMKRLEAATSQPADQSGSGDRRGGIDFVAPLKAHNTTQPQSDRSEDTTPMPVSAPVRTARPARQPADLANYTLDFDTPVDPQLQSALEQIDRKLGEQFGMAEKDRSCGVLDLTDLRLAMVRSDQMDYAASVPKICTLLAYFETHPEAASDLDPAVQRELERMIKISDNEMAAKYSQLVGLETIQKILESDKYKLYDRQHGGGLWVGKHYGVAEPRIGDPLLDHSHAATVRQCLRYYLLMEQGKLVSPAASAKMKEIFAAPLLDTHPHNFVDGLRHRNVTMIRKSGEWEDWHLDTARIEHGERVYLLAGMTHHPKGQEYLAALAAAADDLLCGPSPMPPYRHDLIVNEVDQLFEERAAYGSGPILRAEALVGFYATMEAPAMASKAFFNEILISWNIDTPPETGYWIELRVGRRGEEWWSPWLLVGEGGDTLLSDEKVVECPHGRIDVDWFRSQERFNRLQYRVRSFPATPYGCTSVRGSARVHRIAVCYSDTTGLPLAARPTNPPKAAPPESRWQRRLPVPFRSQKDEDPSLAGRICSPTSLAMVLAYRGVDRPTREVCERVYDAAHNIYGNWPYNVQAAWTYGVPGYLTRFSDWDDVKRCIAEDQPLIISIKAKEGELQGAPYKETDGHLLVLVGFDASGDVEVSDPAAATAEQGQRVYRRNDLEKVWMANGGTAYVLLPIRGQ